MIGPNEGKVCRKVEAYVNATFSFGALANLFHGHLADQSLKTSEEDRKGF